MRVTDRLHPYVGAQRESWQMILKGDPTAPDDREIQGSHREAGSYQRLPDLAPKRDLRRFRHQPPSFVNTAVTWALARCRSRSALLVQFSWNMKRIGVLG